MEFGERTMEDNVLNIENVDQKIYRIFSVDQFKKLILSKELILRNPSEWVDPFENFFLKANAKQNNGQLVSLERLEKSWYGQCWTYNKESDALWNIYSPNKNGVRVSTTIRKLFTSLWDESDIFRGLKYFIGKISYIHRDEIKKIMENTTFLDVSFGGQNDKFARLLCIKRLEFSHENEVRILVYDTDNKGSEGCYRVLFDYKSVLEDVCLDPRLNVNAYAALKSEFENLDCDIPIIQSELYNARFEPIWLE